MSNAEKALAAPDKAMETVEVSRKFLDDVIEKTVKTSAGVQQLALIPKTFQEAEQYAEFISRSQACPRTKDGPWSKADIFLAIQAGLELGIRPIQALSGMMIVNGRVSVWGDLALALILASGEVEEFKERSAREALEKGEGWCRIKRKGHDAIEHRFSREDAKKAGLQGKAGPWSNYEGRMLQMRPRSWAIRDTFADILKGLSIVEEVRDIETEAPIVAAMLKMPQRKGAAAPAPSPAAALPVSSAAPAAPALAPAPAANGNGNTWRGVIEKIEAIQYDEKDRKGTLTGKKATLHVVTGADGTHFGCFSTTALENARTAMNNKTEVVAQLKTDKQGRKSAEVIEPADFGAPSASDEAPPYREEAGPEGDEPGANG